MGSVCSHLEALCEAPPPLLARGEGDAVKELHQLPHHRCQPSRGHLAPACAPLLELLEQRLLRLVVLAALAALLIDAQQRRSMLLSCRPGDARALLRVPPARHCPPRAALGEWMPVEALDLLLDRWVGADAVVQLQQPKLLL
eukprot:6714138-Prymnesium_polylepis.1